VMHRHDQSGNLRRQQEARSMWSARMPEIKRRLAAGESQARIAKTYRCKQYTLSLALRKYQ